MSQEIALLKETNNQIAVRHGLPPVGSTMINQYGIKWLVDGHLFVPTLSTLARGTDPDADDPRDLYPVILPRNLSPQLTNFLAETDRCTSKVIVPLDTLPHLRPHSAHPYGHWIDGLDSPHRILMFLDAAHAHETIIAHEIGHIWIDVVEDCEDYRIFKDLSDTPRVHQWTNLQSFVLDNKVNEVLRDKGFDMSVIENDVEESLLSFAAAIRSGYRPPTAREAAFVASTLATAMLDYETGAQDALQSLDMASIVFRHDLPDVYELACRLAASVRRYGYADRASIRNAVDKCALLAFAFVGEPLNLDTDFVEEVPTEDYNDKYPEYFPGIPVVAKLEIARAMARLKIPGGSECRLDYLSTGSAQVRFCQQSGDWTEPVLLKNLRRLPQNTAFAGSNRMLQRGFKQMNKLPIGTAPSNSPYTGTTPPVMSPSTSGIQPVFPTFPLPGESNGRRSYGPGLARFLSQARLAELFGGEHPYGYAMNNPTTYIDPSGHQANVFPPPPYRFDPGFWNRGDIQTYNNCYCYALNNPCGDRSCGPGYFSGSRFNNCPNGNPSCQNLLANAIRDGMIAVPSRGCPTGWHKVVLFVGPDDGSCTWHWYRQDSNGGWSDKESDFPITNCYIISYGGSDAGIEFSKNRITDPSQDAPKHGTPRKCGALCARNSPVRIKEDPPSTRHS